MIRPGALVLYKNRPAVAVSRDIDRILVRDADGATQKVRDKDLVLLNDGPVDRIPSPSTGGDFETARAMLSPGDSLGWAELAELVFGASGPAQALACFNEAARGACFKITEGLPVPLDDAASAAAEQRIRDREREESDRAAFLLRAKKRDFLPEDSKYISEVEALAYGRTQKSRIAKELGVAETPESAHAFLLKSGLWNDTVNPWPQRAGCPLSPPRQTLPERSGDPGIDGAPRLDLSATRSFAIDNEGSEDPDDAIGIEGDRIWIHVADPASVIVPGSPVDIEAMERGATLYLPERIIPMLPGEAVPRFGLGLSERSPSLSFGIRLADDASIAEVLVAPAVVRVRRMTYTEADVALAAGDPDLTALDAAAARRRARRAANGAVEIDIPEVSHRVRSGEVRIEAVPHSRSADVVREMMLLAGEAAARWAFGRGLPFPYYGQEEPQVSEANRQDEGKEKASLSMQFARRRGMKAGMLGPTPGAHRGLGLPFYSQVTSPLRRYQDLLAHMQIRASLAGDAALPSAALSAVPSVGSLSGISAALPLDTDEISRRCAASGAAIGPNRQAERDSELFWTAVFLQRNPGWKGEGVIVQVSGNDVLCYIPSLGLETRVRSRAAGEIDETVNLSLVRVSLPDRQISFEITP